MTSQPGEASSHMTKGGQAPEELGARLIFVGGAPRSGTTLVQNILDSHTSIVGAPEFLHIDSIVKVGEVLKSSVERGFIDEFCSKEDVDRHFRHLLVSLLFPYLDASGAEILSEKTPANVLVFAELLELFPKARFIHVVRDPRATVASLLGVGQRAREAGEAPLFYATGAGAAARYVRRCMGLGLRAERLAPDRVHQVQYERLVTNPKEECMALCRFLRLPWESQMERPGEVQHPGETAITENSGGIWYDRESFNTNPHQNSLEKWRDNLTPLQRLVIRRTFRSFEPLEDLGYLLEGPIAPSFLRGVPGYLSYARGGIGRRIRRWLAGPD